MMKYLTVTLNPAIDRMYRLDTAFETGKLNRAMEMSEMSFSGKGINVSRELFRLGIDSKVLCILQGDDGKKAFASMKKEELNLFPVMTAGRMRRNISIVDKDGVDTELNEPGCPLEKEDLVTFLGLYDRLISDREEKTVIISGSTPPGIRSDIYRNMIKSASEKGAYVILDADGELLKRGIEGRPDLIKPNEKELLGLIGGRFSGSDIQKRTQALAAAILIHEKTGIEVLCTLGALGSVFAGKEGHFACPAKNVEAKRFKGAGDRYLARFLFEKNENGRSTFDAMSIASEATADYLAE